MTFFVLAIGVGTAWDRAWHASQPFEDFFSPPHLFIYSTFTVAELILLRCTRDAALRGAFGTDLRLPFPFPLLGRSVPRGLALMLGGYGVIALAGACDAVWHTAFGLDETTWSMPHAMLGWGILLALYGIAAARLAVPVRVRWFTRLLFWVLLLSITSSVPTGPLGANHTLEHVQAVAALPPLAANPAPQHTFRIYTTWNLTHAHPLFAPLSAFAVGAGLAAVRRLERSTAVFLVAALLFTWFQLSGQMRTARFLGIAADARNWLPLPVALVALVPALSPVGRGQERWAWLAAGALHALWVVLVWPPGVWAPLSLLAAAPAMLGGARAGTTLAGLVKRPNRRTLALVPGLGIALPAALGLIDLRLRLMTP